MESILTPMVAQSCVEASLTNIATGVVWTVALGAEVLLPELPPPPLHAASSVPTAPASTIREVLVNMKSP
jgi:hypothetical protein